RQRNHLRLHRRRRHRRLHQNLARRSHQITWHIRTHQKLICRLSCFEIDHRPHRIGLPVCHDVGHRHVRCPHGNRHDFPPAHPTKSHHSNRQTQRSRHPVELGEHLEPP